MNRIDDLAIGERQICKEWIRLFLNLFLVFLIHSRHLRNSIYKMKIIIHLPSKKSPVEKFGGRSIIKINSGRKIPLHIPLDDRTKTTGVILTEHMKCLDVISRNIQFVEKMSGVNCLDEI